MLDDGRRVGRVKFERLRELHCSQDTATGATLLCQVIIPQKQAICAGGSDGSLHVWTGKRTTSHRFTDHIGPIKCLIAVTRAEDASHSPLLATGSADRTIRVWDPWVREQEKACIQTIRGHEGSITALASHRRLLFSCSTDATVKIWQMDDGRELLMYPWYSLHETIADSKCWLSAIATHFVGESGELYVADTEATLSVYQLTVRGHQVTVRRDRQHQRLHALGITHILAVQHENILVTSAHDLSARVLNCQTGQPMVTVNNPRGVRFSGLAWSSSSRELFLSDQTGAVYTWSMMDEALLQKHRLSSGTGDEVAISSLACDGDNLHLTAGSRVSHYLIIRDSTFEEIPGHAGPVVALQAPSDVKAGERQLMYSASHDNTIRAWDTYDMACINTFVEKQSEISCLLLAHVNGSLFSGHDDGSIRLVNMDAGSALTMKHHTNTVCCMDVALRGKSELLLSGGFDGCIAVWDITKKRYAVPQIDAVFVAHAPFEVLTLKADQARATFISGGNDHQIRVWALENYELLHTLAGHSDAVTCLELDGNFLLSGSDDGSVRVWDLHANTVCAVRVGPPLQGESNVRRFAGAGTEIFGRPRAGSGWPAGYSGNWLPHHLRRGHRSAHLAIRRRPAPQRVGTGGCDPLHVLAPDPATGRVRHGQPPHRPAARRRRGRRFSAPRPGTPAVVHFSGGNITVSCIVADLHLECPLIEVKVEAVAHSS